jgi:hypothetical protein
MEEEAPDWSLCPITHEKMSNPVVDPEGNSYEEGAILVWLRNKQISPITRRPLYANQLSSTFHFCFRYFLILQAHFSSIKLTAPNFHFERSERSPSRFYFFVDFRIYFLIHFGLLRFSFLIVRVVW